MNRILFSFVLISAMFSSCTITKRVHRNGYHIDWKTNHKHGSSEEVNNNVKVYKQNSIETDYFPEEQISVTDQTVDQSSTALHSTNDPQVNKVEIKVAQPVHSVIERKSLSGMQTYSKEHIKEMAAKKNNFHPDHNSRSRPAFITALILGFLGVLLIVLSFVFIEALFFLFFIPLLIGAVLILLALVFIGIGIIAL